MKKEQHNGSLPLTVIRGNIKEYNEHDIDFKSRFISIEKYKSEIIPENFYKPISKMIFFNESE